MEAINLLGSILGLGFVSGVNLYATVLTVGLGVRLGAISLSPELQALEILGNPLVLIVAGVIFLAEFVADKIPWFDSLWDAIHTIIRPLGAAGVGAAAIGSFEPQTVVVAALCGGTALTSHSTKAGTRLIANHSPEPFSNIVISFVEDVLVVGGTWFAVTYPLAALFLVLTFIVLFCVFAPKVFRLIRVEMIAAVAVVKMLYNVIKQSLSGLFGQTQTAGTNYPANMPIPPPPPDLHEKMPEKFSYYANHQTFIPERIGCLRCVAGRGVKGLKNSVGYLFVCPDKIVFVTRKWFRFREHEINRYHIEDVHFKKRLLLDRIIIRIEGKPKQFFFFKDFAKRPNHFFEILQVHRKN